MRSIELVWFAISAAIAVGAAANCGGKSNQKDGGTSKGGSSSSGASSAGSAGSGSDTGGASGGFTSGGTAGTNEPPGGAGGTNGDASAGGGVGAGGAAGGSAGSNDCPADAICEVCDGGNLCRGTCMSGCGCEEPGDNGCREGSP